MKDEVFKAIHANVTPLQEEVMGQLDMGESDHQVIALKLSVPELHITYAIKALEGMGLIEDLKP